MLLLRVVQAVRGEAAGAGEEDARRGERRRRPEAAASWAAAAAAREAWCGGRPKKLGNTVGACGTPDLRLCVNVPKREPREREIINR